VYQILAASVALPLREFRGQDLCRVFVQTVQQKWEVVFVGEELHATFTVTLRSYQVINKRKEKRVFLRKEQNPPFSCDLLARIAA
jgi:hypothetical protein